MTAAASPVTVNRHSSTIVPWLRTSISQLASPPVTSAADAVVHAWERYRQTADPLWNDGPSQTGRMTVRH